MDPSKCEPYIDTFVSCYRPGDVMYGMSMYMETDKMRVCSTVKVAMYCSAECQRKHREKDLLVCDK